MLKTVDTLITSSDLSLDRVLQSGMPAALVFHEGELSSDLRQAADELAHIYSGKVLVVGLARNDASQAAARFGVQSFPTLVAVQDGKASSSQPNVKPAELKAHVAYLAGEAPKPASQPQGQPSRPQPASKGGAPVPVTEATFDREVLQAHQPVLVDFWAVWCGPCRMMDPTLEKLAHEQPGGLKIAKVNVDENPNLAMRFGVQGIPTMLVFVNGQEKDRLVGALPEGALRNRVARWTQSA